MSGQARTSIAIIGGGATGSLLALHLLRSTREDLRVTLVERRPDPGKGLAYSTSTDLHLLNVAAGRMGAFTDQPDHFWNWIVNNGLDGGQSSTDFLPRHLYGRYLAELVGEAAGDGTAKARLRVVQDNCIGVTPTLSGVSVQLESGVSLPSHVAVLAVGHDPEPGPQFGFAARPCIADELEAEPDDDVLILGTGLSMIDAWLTLASRGHRGRIVVLSRRGLLPHPHSAERRPLQLDLADIPLGTEFSYFVRWFTRLISEAEATGRNWRDVIDGVRPFNQRIWMDWPVSARRRFLQHYKAWWDIHRHRIPQDIRNRAEKALGDGSLELIAGRVVELEEQEGRKRLRFRRRGARQTEEDAFDRVFDCTGIIRDITQSSSPVIRNLVERGLARPDPLRLGLDVTAECALISADGRASDRIFAAGPPTRGAFFEVDAIQEIRQQCAALARRLAEPATAAPPGAQARPAP
ncbi:FAD/NAD(P)-binding protein [Mesorhizobium sp. J428]|uniref:FAD/NAD(P)-binding protein n=1 Tax=Mesorhizobium sp. J428 TaxID=2898440 RepID=UPI002150B016|nr:FAD-dependent oxidoreductase [Mesorhizobium sp. J428]MCR5855452.1 FAD-dependent oxidoreductase [Mesorhizobium sp. J428]